MAKPKLTVDQDEHMWGIIDNFSNEMSKKYPEGAENHGGNLWDMTALQLVREAKKEALDQYTYLDTLEKKLLK